MSGKENEKNQAEQLSLFDDFFNTLSINEGEVSFDELNAEDKKREKKRKGKPKRKDNEKKSIFNRLPRWIYLWIGIMFSTMIHVQKAFLPRVFLMA